MESTEAMEIEESHQSDGGSGEEQHDKMENGAQSKSTHEDENGQENGVRRPSAGEGSAEQQGTKPEEAPFVQGNAEASAEGSSEPVTEADAQPEIKTEIESTLEVEAEPAPETETEPTEETGVEPTEAVQEIGGEPKAETEGTTPPETEGETEAEQKIEHVTKTSVEPAAEIADELTAQTGVESETGIGVEPASETGFEPVTQPEDGTIEAGDEEPFIGEKESAQYFEQEEQLAESGAGGEVSGLEEDSTAAGDAELSDAPEAMQTAEAIDDVGAFVDAQDEEVEEELPEMREFMGAERRSEEMSEMVLKGGHNKPPSAKPPKKIQGHEKKYRKSYPHIARRFKENDIQSALRKPAPAHDYFGLIFSAESERPPSYYHNYFLPIQKQPLNSQHLKIVGKSIRPDAVKSFIKAPLNSMSLSTIKVRWILHRRSTVYKASDLYAYLTKYGKVEHVYQLSNNSALVVFEELESALAAIKDPGLGYPWGRLIADWLEPRMNNRNYFNKCAGAEVFANGIPRQHWVQNQKSELRY